jgi:hypothetical protein
MKYRRLLAPAIVVPKQRDGEKFVTGQLLTEGSVVCVMKKNQLSAVTGKPNEITVRWKDASGREMFGWLAKNTPMDGVVKKKELSRGSGDIRVTGWDTVRLRMSSHPGWDIKKWVCTFAEQNVPLLHAVIRELGGKVPKSDDPFVAIKLVVKLSTGEGITMATAEKTKAKAKSSKKSKTAKSSKKSSTKKTSKAKSNAGRTSAFAGLRIVRTQKENPRREGSTGFDSWNLIKKGMTYEEFLKAGGDSGCLRTEVAAGRIKMKKVS